METPVLHYLGIAAASAVSLITSEASASTSLAIDTTAWSYDSTNKVYYQIGISYCADPATTTYETLGIYVPGSYMTGTSNGDGTYTCTVNKYNIVNGYTAETAPIVIPVNTPGYSEQAAPTSYS